MNYIEWIATIGLAVNLIVKTDFDRDLNVRLEWNHPLPVDLFTSDSVPSLYISFHSKNNQEKLTGLHLIPWDNLQSPYNRVNEIGISQYSLFTVTEYALVYEDISTSRPDETKKEYLDKLYTRLKNLFDYEGNQQIISKQDGITTAGGVQLISQKEYKYYLEQEIALPGSKSPLRFDADSMSENKMILRYLIPDIGPVKYYWSLPATGRRDECLNSSDPWILESVNRTIRNLLESDSFDLKNEYDKTMLVIEKHLGERNCNTNEVLSYYKNALQRIFNCREQTIIELPVDNIFGDYQPKLTPDELYDYMPSICEEVQKLPSAELRFLPDLLAGYRKYKKMAARNKGKWVEGNVILGANEKEYEPSYEELMLCEIGSRINLIRETYSVAEVQELASGIKLKPGKIRFKKFGVVHYDVMGSGRFFYISSVDEIRFDLY